MVIQTLLLRLHTPCSGCGARCRYLFEKQLDLDPRILEKLTSILYANECVILCSSPLKHTDTLHCLRILESMCRRIVLLLPLPDLSIMTRPIYDSVDEVVFVISCNAYTSHSVEGLLRLAVEGLGLEKISTYLVVESRRDVSMLKKLVKTIHSYGIRVRVGEKPYAQSRHIDVRAELIRSRIEVGLPYTTLYGYRASTAMLEGIPITLLFKDSSFCNIIYLDVDGRLCRCPFRPDKCIDLKTEKLDELELRKLTAIHCTTTTMFIPMITVSMVVNGVEIPSEVMQLLELILYFKSLRKACSALDISISSCIDKIKKLEVQLGTKLVISQQGGREGGFTELTSYAVKIVEKYRYIKNEIAKHLISVGEDNFVLL